MAAGDVVRCFWMEETDRQQRWLRRYAPSELPREDDPQGVCPGPYRYHSALVRVEDGPMLWKTYPDWNDDEKVIDMPPIEEYMRDSRWPYKCEYCDYVFTDSDRVQIYTQMIYTTGDREFTTEDAPAGAMWDATYWTPEKWRGSDGRCLAVKLPPARKHDYWLIDGPAGDGGHWQRVGSTLPDISVTPSILSDKYHGFLTNGSLVEV